MVFSTDDIKYVHVSEMCLLAYQCKHHLSVEFKDGTILQAFACGHDIAFLLAYIGQEDGSHPEANLDDWADEDGLVIGPPLPGHFNGVWENKSIWSLIDVDPVRGLCLDKLVFKLGTMKGKPPKGEASIFAAKLELDNLKGDTTS